MRGYGRLKSTVLIFLQYPVALDVCFSLLLSQSLGLPLLVEPLIYVATLTLALPTIDTYVLLLWQICNLRFAQDSRFKHIGVVLSDQEEALRQALVSH